MGCLDKLEQHRKHLQLFFCCAEEKLCATHGDLPGFAEALPSLTLTLCTCAEDSQGLETRGVGLLKRQWRLLGLLEGKKLQLLVKLTLERVKLQPLGELLQHAKLW
mmetsp:Transcript_115787/g.188669  ORF Transcript_115787/g.188669 Transcript_115787/m.188669 type:complete len:106 (-) Transcript_115787:90-407(-)